MEEEEACDCVEAPGDCGDWICKENLLENLSCAGEEEQEIPCINTMESNANRSCFHKFDEHIKSATYSSGDYLRKDRIDSLYNNANLNSTNISAFLNIGAEAEKRREEKFKKMISDLEQVSKNNKLLCADNQRKNGIIETLKCQLQENNTLICNLKNELNIYKQKFCDLQKKSSNLYSLQCESDSLKRDKLQLENKVLELSYRCSEMEELLSQRHSEQDQTNTVAQLNCLIDKAKEEVKIGKEEIECLTENNDLLKKQIWQMSNELKEICLKQAEKNKCYNDTIHKLQTQLQCLSKKLIAAQEELNKKTMTQEKLKNVMKTMFKQSNCAQNQRLEELQEIISKQAQEINYLEGMNSAASTQLHNELETLDNLLLMQNKEINNMKNQVKVASEEDAESIAMLNDISQLNCEMAREPRSCNLLQRIYKIRSRVQARIQREQFKYEKSCREINLLRCQFAKLQKEIESLRATNNAECREEIKCRILKEQELSKAILRSEQEAEYSKTKLAPLHKTWKNIDKMEEVVRQINFT